MPLLQKFTVNETVQPASPQLFQQEMHRHFAVGLAVQSPQAKPFQTQVTGYSGRRLRFAALRFSPHTTANTMASQQGLRSSHMLITQQKEGVSWVRQDGREGRIAPGDIFMIDPAQPFFIETGAILTHSVFIDAALLRSTLPGIDGLTARAVDTQAGGGAVFRAVLEEIFARADVLDDDAADRIADALPHLVSAALAPMLKDQAPPPSRLRLLHRQRVQRYIRDHLRDPDLDAAAIAAGVNLSLRHLYALLADDESPPMQQVWALRLERCHAELCSASLAGRSIGELAYFWGFRDVAHFSRAFRKRYGAAPREVRRAHAAGG